MSIKTQAAEIFADSNRWQAAIARTSELRSSLDRKFQSADVIDYPWLRLVGQHFATTYLGTFEYLVEMREIAQGLSQLSAGQTAGVLNCAIADWTRADRFAAGTRVQGDPLPNVKDVPSSRYRVVQPDGKSLAVRLGDVKWAADKAEGTRGLWYLGQGADWVFSGFISPAGEVRLDRAEGMRKSLTAALSVLVDSVREGRWLVHALAWSVEGSSCCFCGRDLDTAESISVGYGPVCADKYGLPWGDVAEPASVVIARDALIDGGIKTEEAVPETAADQRSTWNHSSPLGTFESGAEILRKHADRNKRPGLAGLNLKPSTYRAGRSYEDIFGAE